MAQINQNLSPVPVNIGGVPKEGPLAIPASYDFSSGTASPIQVDLSYLIAQQVRMSMVQSVFIDNSGNNQPVVVSVGGTTQQIALYAGWQGFFPILATGVPKFTIATAGTGIVNVQYQNFQIQASQWPANPANASSVTIPVSDAILDATVSANRVQTLMKVAPATVVDHSGTIAVGNTAQQLMAANPSRQGFIVMNIDEVINEEMAVSVVGAAALATPGSITLATSPQAGYPGGVYQGVGSGAISIIAATAGHKFTAYEW